MPSASDCTEAWINFNDDLTDTSNNLTLSFYYTNYSTFDPMLPTMRIAQLVGSNMSDIPPECWNTTIEFVAYIQGLFEGVENDFNRFLISYLFTQMGYALTYRRIITKIDENNENQAYEANMAQYGQIIN